MVHYNFGDTTDSSDDEIAEHHHQGLGESNEKQDAREQEQPIAAAAAQEQSQEEDHLQGLGVPESISDGVCGPEPPFSLLLQLTDQPSSAFPNLSWL
eukprot:COSAG02_NODE_175_length_31226_cov_95.275934_6_plen_97_part_00